MWHRAEELAAPYYVFKDHSYVVDIASVKGGAVPMDPESLRGQHGRNSAVRKFREDGEVLAGVCA